MTNINLKKKEEKPSRQTRLFNASKQIFESRKIEKNLVFHWPHAAVFTKWKQREKELPDDCVTESQKWFSAVNVWMCVRARNPIGIKTFFF